ncbi:MATE family efflux transporter [Parvibaculum sp.]|uniref:MATE family efflux transporter n=1 Tax=Parvibaculum sp. TaxID=2024848 RepID=UPI000C647E22|nr:MATE family efflux transporter [Parvibaculum sp.]HAC59027.1 MATE family efflux transporter [Rhodobiaceae bacterium]MAU61828.1 MATE family efflux transporter [Parvibaculum sp.]MBO6666713.1 MATE family efflux transporter [Parvibaculum sp.]MBO6693626.1 MATE family efflux transporter [Parvibaculum sp.]MBO6713334.1 MATE family efflux transporter [Parvibaculum sp.]|tara:strand:- start:52094 stop:53416 length:1323 start_codon:yes stop_codon:yes gene_type:complete
MSEIPARPRVTHRAVLAIALPIVISNISTPLLGFADTAVMGRMGDPKYIGAVALGALIFTMVYWTFGFLRMGTTGLTAQAEGAGDGEEIRAALGRAVLIAGAIGAGLIAAQWPIALIAFSLLDGGPEVEALARGYFDIRIWSAPFALANYALAGWFIGLGRAKIALVLQVFLNLVNVFFNIWLALGLGWGVAGIAAGTLIAEIAAALLGLAIAARALGAYPGTWTRARLLDAARLARTIAVNRDIMIRTVVLLLSFAWFTAKSAEAGNVTLAVNSILLQFVTVSAFFLDGFALAAETLVGKATGARSLERFDMAAKLSTLQAGGISLVLTAAIFVFGGAIIDFLTIDAEVRAAARVYLAWAAMLPVLSVWCYQLDGIFIGATRSAEMRNAALVSSGIFLFLWWLFLPYGNHGLWAALTGFNLMRAASLGFYFPRLRRGLA